MRVVYPRFSFARTSLSSFHAPSFICKVCSELGIQMVDGLGIQLLSLTPYTQHYDWGTLVFFSAGTWEWQNSFSARCFARFCRKGFQPKCLEVLKLLSSTPLFQQVWGTSLLKWGKPRNESIIAALTGQQSPDNDKEDFWCCRLTWFFLPSQCGGDDDDDANDVNDINDVALKKVSSPSFLRSGCLTNFPRYLKIQLRDVTLTKRVCSPFGLQGDKPFAELWMGDHPSGPARVQSPSGKDAPKKKHLCEKLRKNKAGVFPCVVDDCSKVSLGL